MMIWRFGRAYISRILFALTLLWPAFVFSKTSNLGEPQVNSLIKGGLIRVQGESLRVPAEPETSVYSGERLDEPIGGIADIRHQDAVIPRHPQESSYPDRPSFPARASDIEREISSSVSESKIREENNRRFRAEYYRQISEKINAELKRAGYPTSGAR